MAFPQSSGNITDVALLAEDLGFESIWLPEHPIMPVHTNSKYGGTPDGSIPDYMSDLPDPYIMLGMASSVTKSLKLGTGISLIPERNPLILAKTISALDLYSQGRFLLGVGGGWLREETEIMGGDFDHRWSQIKESILSMKELWTKDEASFKGNHYNFPPVKCYPKPFQKPHPPILLGGSSNRVYQRVVEYADGWIPVGLTLDQVKQGMDHLIALSEKSQRDPHSISVTVYGQPPDPSILEAWRKIGVNRVIVRLSTTKEGEFIAEMNSIAEALL